MLSPAETQAAFAAALLDPELPVPPYLHSLGEPAGADRFAVYRNNVMVALIGAMGDAYPVVRRLVGDEFFRAMAAIFTRANPPRSPAMLEYGDGFAEFVAQFPPAASVPYLADVARLERAWVEAYHAPEAEPICEARAMPVRLHPATRLVRSSYPVLAIWEANRAEDEPQALELSDQGDNVLVTRPAAEVQASRIPDDAAEFIESVVAGQLPNSGDHLDCLRSLGAFAAREALA
jgi:hypothetical protein